MQLSIFNHPATCGICPMRCNCLPLNVSLHIITQALRDVKYFSKLFLKNLIFFSERGKFAIIPARLDTKNKAKIKPFGLYSRFKSMYALINYIGNRKRLRLNLPKRRYFRRFSRKLGYAPSRNTRYYSARSFMKSDLISSSCFSAKALSLLFIE